MLHSPPPFFSFLGLHNYIFEEDSFRSNMKFSTSTTKLSRTVTLLIRNHKIQVSLQIPFSFLLQIAAVSLKEHCSHLNAHLVKRQ